MSENRPSGPAMVIATSVMKRGPVRIAKISEDIVLPRPVRLSVLLAASAGALLGLALGLAVGGVSGGIYGALFFGASGALAVTWSPLQGESLSKWLELSWGTRRRSHFRLEGQAVRVAVGICPVPDPVMGGFAHIRPGAVRIPPTQYDERGVRINEKNHNLDRAEWTPSLRPASADEAYAAPPPAEVPFGYTGVAAPSHDKPSEECGVVQNPWLPTFEPPRLVTAPPAPVANESKATVDPAHAAGTPQAPQPSVLPWLGANPSARRNTED